MRLRLLVSAAVAAVCTTSAVAEIDLEALSRAYQAEGYSRVEVRRGPTQVRLEAIRGSTLVEVIYDRATGRILRQEVGRVDDDADTRPAVEIDTRDSDFVEGEDEEDEVDARGGEDRDDGDRGGDRDDDREDGRGEDRHGDRGDDREESDGDDRDDREHGDRDDDGDDELRDHDRDEHDRDEAARDDDDREAGGHGERRRRDRDGD